MRRKKIIGLLLFLFIIIVSKNIFGMTLNIGEEYTFQFSDLSENGNVPYKFTGASSENDDIISVEEKKTGIWPLRAITAINIKALKVGTTELNISGLCKILSTDGKTEIDQPIGKTFTIEVRDYAKEEEEKAAQKVQDYETAYNDIPDANADGGTIWNFVLSDHHYHGDKNLVSLAKTDEGVATLKAWKGKLAGFRGDDAQAALRIISSLIDANKDEKKIQAALDEHKDDLDEQSQEREKQLMRAYKAALGESRKTRGEVFNVDILEDIDLYEKTDIDPTSAGRIENTTSRILTVISNIGIAVAVIMLAILGIKYMLGSVEEKAEYKEGLIPYVVGAFILFGITGFVKILIVFGDKINGI